MNIQYLPDVLINMIFLYLQSPEAKLIKDEIQIYENDHNPYYSKRARYYYVKNFMSFSNYYFDKLYEPFDYESWHREYASKNGIKY